jgi:hypothetical protein
MRRWKLIRFFLIAQRNPVASGIGGNVRNPDDVVRLQQNNASLQTVAAPWCWCDVLVSNRARSSAATTPASTPLL